MVIAELTRYASLIAGIVRDSRKPGAGVRRNVFVATMQQLESDLDDLRRTADLGDAAHSVMETASALNHAQANPESMATFLRPAQVSIATAIKQYRRQHSAGQSLKSTAIKTNQHVTLPDGKRAVVTGVALGSDGEPLVRVKAVKAIDWRSTLLALQPIVQGAIAAAQRGVFTSKEERIFTRASAMLKRASVGVGAGIPKEAANFARTAQQASDSAKRYGQLASLPDDQHKPGEKETCLRTYAHTASAVMTYLKEAINAIPATRTVTKSADVNGGRYVLKNFIPQLKRIAFSGHNKLLKSPQNQHLAEQVQGELKNIINLISQVRGFIELDLAAYRQLRAEVSEFMNTQDFAESAQYVGRYVQKLEKDLKQALAHSAKSADVIVLAAREVRAVKATPEQQAINEKYDRARNTLMNVYKKAYTQVLGMIRAQGNVKRAVYEQLESTLSTVSDEHRLVGDRSNNWRSTDPAGYAQVALFNYKKPDVRLAALNNCLGDLKINIVKLASFDKILPGVERRQRPFGASSVSAKAANLRSAEFDTANALAALHSARGAALDRDLQGTMSTLSVAKGYLQSLLANLQGVPDASVLRLVRNHIGTVSGLLALRRGDYSPERDILNVIKPMSDELARVMQYIKQQRKAEGKSVKAGYTEPIDEAWWKETLLAALDYSLAALGDANRGKIADALKNNVEANGKIRDCRNPRRMPEILPLMNQALRYTVAANVSLKNGDAKKAADESHDAASKITEAYQVFVKVAALPPWRRQSGKSVKADDFVALRPDMDFHEYGRTVYQYAKLIESDPNPTSRLNKLNRLRAKLKKLNIGILGGDLPYLAKIAANAKRELRGAPPAPRVTKAADYEDTATLQSYVAQTITAIQRAYSAFNQSGQASIVGLRAPMLWIKLIAKELKDVDYGAPRYALERWHSVMKWGEMKITSKDPEWQRMLRVMQLCVDDMKFIQVKLGR